MKKYTKVAKINSPQILMIRILLLTVVIFIFSYLYFVNSAAFNAAAQEKFAEEIDETKSLLGELELDYMEKNREIKKELATQFNLTITPDSEVTFVKRDLATKLSFNE